MTNVPSTFQRGVDIILKDIKWKFTIPYLDDIIVYSNSIQEHKEHLKIVMERLRDNNLFLNPDKACLFENL